MKARYVLVVCGLSAALLLGLLMVFTIKPPATTTTAPVMDGAAVTVEAAEGLPPGALPALARAIADDLPESYHVQSDAAGYLAENAAHALATTFAAAGARFEIAGETWGLALTGLGRDGAAVAAVPAVAPVAAGPRLEYRRGALTEWYLNTHWGMEQGFTLHSRPAGSGDLLLALRTSGTLKAVSAGDTALALQDDAGQTLAHYTGLHVYDANGQTLPAHLALAGEGFHIVVDDTGATYPVTVDPWIQSARLTASDGADRDVLGSSVAMSGDIIVAGAPRKYVNGEQFVGVAYVFAKPAGGWDGALNEVAKLVASDGPGLPDWDFFGETVAIDGDTVVVGARGSSGGSVDSRGAAYVFTKPAGGWSGTLTETAKLTTAGPIGFGRDVDIADDTIVVAAFEASSLLGDIYVFTRPGGGWSDGISPTAILTGTGEYRLAGTYVSIDKDGGTIVGTGAEFISPSVFTDIGALVFTRPVAGWSTVPASAYLHVDMPFGSGIGVEAFRVDIDGDTIVVLAQDYLSNGDGQGFVFTEPVGGWSGTLTHSATLVYSDYPVGGALGADLTAVDIQGNAVVIGVRNFVPPMGGSGTGALYLYTKPVGGWSGPISHTTKIMHTDTYGPWDPPLAVRLGTSVAIEGTVIVGGAPNYDPVPYDMDSMFGAVYVFEPELLLKSVTPTSIGYHETVTYTLTLGNSGLMSDTNVLLTDTLPAQVDFARWITKPSNTTVLNDEITWNGSIQAGEILTWTWVVTHTGDYGDVVANTAVFSGTRYTGQYTATFSVGYPPYLYVDWEATGAATGLSWTDAYTNVQDALDYANAHPSQYQIWVAEGVYYPDEDSDGDHVDNDAGEYFTIAHPYGTQLYGGFDPQVGVDEWAERDWETYLTILSGDLEQNDGVDARGVVTDTAHITGVNAQHVVYLDSFYIASNNIIDGFIITGGQADGAAPHNTGGGLSHDAEPAWAGGYVLFDPIVRNVIFSGNYASGKGGALYGNGSHIANYGMWYGGASPSLENVTFTGNAAAEGGAMYTQGTGGFSNPSLTNVTFSGNAATGDGGAMYTSGDIDAGVMALTNVLFSGNAAGSSGGGMYNTASAGNAFTATLMNVTFGSNQAVSGGGMANVGNGGSNSPSLTNVVLWGNAATNGTQLYNADATPSLSYTLVQSDTLNDIYNTGSTVVAYGAEIRTDDPLFVAPVAAASAPTAAGDYRLQALSPAIDTGTNTGCPADDLNGLTRPNDGDADTVATCDLGAYEAGTKICGIIEPGTHTFTNEGGVSIQITTLGTLHCLYVDATGIDHPYATGTRGGSGLKTGRYWSIQGFASDGATGAASYTVNLTLPHNGVNAPKVCRYTGAGWDCAATGSDGNSVWRNGIMDFSDWTVGQNVGPNAISLRGLAARGALFGNGALLALGLLALGAAVFVFKRR